MSNFKVTKALIDAYVNNGFTVRMMAEDITKQSGTRCSDAVVRAACKTYSVDLRHKKNPTVFVFDDLGTNVVHAVNAEDTHAPNAPQLDTRHADASATINAGPRGLVTPVEYVHAEEPTVSL